MKIGYARISTKEQKLELQIDALKKYDCEKIYSDIQSGSIKERPELMNAMAYIRENDEFVVWKLDRLGRSIKDLINWMNIFQERKINFISLQENINTNTATGKMIFNIFATLAEFERDLLLERSRAGMEAARKRGRQGGRPKKILEQNTINTIQKLYKDQEMTVKEIGNMFGISRSSVYNYLPKTNKNLRKK